MTALQRRTSRYATNGFCILLAFLFILYIRQTQRVSLTTSETGVQSPSVMIDMTEEEVDEIKEELREGRIGLIPEERKIIDIIGTLSIGHEYTNLHTHPMLNR